MEIWKKSRIDDNYEVSNLGRIKSIERVERVVGHWGGTFNRRYGGKILNPAKNARGYLQITGTKKKFHLAHRLIAHEFVCGYQEGHIVNHKNGDRSDNRAENLEWVTHKENLLHGYRVLGSKPAMKGRFGRHHPTSKAVVRTCIKTMEKKYYESMTDAVRDGFDSGQISKCASRKAKSHKGYTWAKISFDLYQERRMEK